jgi:malonyl-CoA O-methyltransferase
VSALPAREAYRLWAPDYERETAVSALELETVDALGVATAGRALLDVGCGTGRRLRASGGSPAIGVDLSPEMLGRAPAPLAIAAADLRALPIARNTFDVVWCRLVIGHVAELAAAYAELARVCRAGGVVIVTDLSPHAAAAGHRRTFRDASGAAHEVEHFVHTMRAHVLSATRAGLALLEQREGVCGERVRPFYAHAGRLSAYEEQRGTPIVLALAWHKRGE